MITSFFNILSAFHFINLNVSSHFEGVSSDTEFFD